jgi:hypothetical protein
MTTPRHIPARSRRRLGALRRLVAAALVTTVAATVLASSPAPGQVPGGSLDLKVLVVSTGPRAADAGLELMARTMDQYGVPYDVVDSSATELTDAMLRDGDRGRYNGVILTSADLYTPSGSGFTLEEWQRLHAYERDFGVRESVVSGFPATNPALDLDYGMGAVAALPTSTGRWVAPAGTGRLFSYVNTTNTLAIPEYSVSGTPRGAGGTSPAVTPLLVDHADPSRALVSRLSYADGREVLLSTIGNAWYRLHSNVLAYQFLDFATKGLFIGGRTVSLSTHADDLFLADDLWDPVANVTDTNQQYRITPADLDALVARQNALRAAHPLASGWKVIHSFNGVGADNSTTVTRTTAKANQDTRLSRSMPLRNWGRSTTLVVDRSTTSENRALIKPSSVTAPAGTLAKVVLTVQVTTSNVALPVQVCPVTQSWTEGSGTGVAGDQLGASWTYRSTTANSNRWTTPGATYDAARCVSATLPTSGKAVIDITSIHAAWKGGLANNGVVVLAAADGSATLASAETGSAANRPAIGFDVAAPTDPLTARVVQLRDEFGWINHTYRALQMDRLCPDPDEPQPAECPRTDYQTAYDEIAQNRTVWTTLGLPDYEEGLAYLLSDSHAGLHDRNGTEEDASDDVPFPQGLNPAFFQAAQDLGVRYVASDSSRPNQDREQRVPGYNVFVAPRYPTNAYVNATTPAQNTDEYNWIYHERYVAQGQDPCTIPAAICATKTYEQVLEYEADTTVTHMLSGKAWPHYFHQTNLHDYGGGRSLLTDWFDAVMTRYDALFTLPVKTPLAYELGPALEDRVVAAEQHVRGWVDLATGQVTLQADGAARPLVTGLAGGEVYGGQSQRKVDVGTTMTTFTAEDQVRTVLPPPPPVTTTTTATIAPAPPDTTSDTAEPTPITQSGSGDGPDGATTTTTEAGATTPTTEESPATTVAGDAPPTTTADAT